MNRDLSSLSDPVNGRRIEALRDLGMSDDEIGAYFARFSNLSMAISAPRRAGGGATAPKTPRKPRGAHTVLQKELGSEETFESPALNAFIAAERRNIEEFVNAQMAQFEKFQSVSRYWLDRAQTEAKLALVVSAKLAAARSLSEAAAAFQEWASRQIQLAAEDANRMIADRQTLAQTGTRMLPGGWISSAEGSSST